MFHIPDSNFPFQDLLWSKPVSILGEPNHFLIKMHLGNKTTPVYIQTPPSLLKDETFTKVGKHTYIDFVLDHEKKEFIEWMEKLEENCQKQLNLNQNDWFESQLSEEDVDNLFITPFKVIKGKGDKCFSFRTNVSRTLKLFNEEKEEIVKDEKEAFSISEKVIAMIQIMGIKCSPRNFHVDFEVKQMMLLKENPLFASCWIDRKKSREVKESEVKDDKEVKDEKEEKDDKEDVLSSVNIEDDLIFSEEKGIEIKSRKEIFQEELNRAFEKAKTARHLGIMNFLKSRQYKFDMEQIGF